MAKILLHIGGEKTGTTTLQAFLSRNTRRLLKRYGVLYPTAGPLFMDGGHFPCVSAFLEPARCEFVPPPRRIDAACVAREVSLLAHRESARLVVLSAEHFSSRLEWPGIAALAEALAPHAVEVAFYVRRQDDLAVSAFSTALRSGERRWLSTKLVTPARRYFNHLAVANDWARAFGAASLGVRAFDRLGDGIEADFLAVLGVDSGDGFEPVARLKRKLSLEQAILLHAINRHLACWPSAVADDDLDGYYRAQRLRERLVRLAPDETEDGISLAAALGEDCRRTIMAAFAASNRELARRYGASIPDDPAPRNGAAPMAPGVPWSGIDGSSIDGSSIDGSGPARARIEVLSRALAQSGGALVDLEEQVSALRSRSLAGRLRWARSVLARCAAGLGRTRPSAPGAPQPVQASPRLPISRNFVRR